MKRLVLFALVLSVLLMSAYTCEASSWYETYFSVGGYNADSSRVVDRFSWNGYSHLAITWNNTVYTAVGLEMNPDGIPVAYYWADIYPTYYDLYITYDGYNWYHYGTYYYQ